MPKILILRFSSIGDIVLTTPVVRAVKLQVKDAEVHYCTKPAFRPILEANPHIGKVHCLEGSLGALVQELKKEKFDYIIDLHNNLRTSIIKQRLGVRSKSFDKLNFEKWLLVNLKLNRLPAVHIVDRYLNAGSELGIQADGKGLDYFIPVKDQVSPEQLPVEFRQGYAAMAIGAQHFTKRLPLEKLVELCRRISLPLVLLGGKEDAGRGAELESQLKKEGRLIWNSCGKFNLNQSASLVQQSKLVFSHDTGLMHIAAAFGREIYSIWGNTIPGFGMYPYKAVYHVLENTTLPCRPCSKIGYGKCPQGHFKCMYGQDFSKVNV